MSFYVGLMIFSLAHIFELFCCFRTGCRPFIEVYEGDKRILSTAQEVEQMRYLKFPLNVINDN